jgi:hypothetical protein
MELLLALWKEGAVCHMVHEGMDHVFEFTALQADA